jgi:hypothetical protein
VKIIIAQTFSSLLSIDTIEANDNPAVCLIANFTASVLILTTMPEIV